MQFFSVNDNMMVRYRNFGPHNLCHHVRYNSKPKTVYKVVFVLPSVKKKKKKKELGILGIWALSNTFAQM